MDITIAHTRSNDPEVHVRGCADIARGLRTGKYQDSWDITVDTREAAVREHWADIIDSYVSEGDYTEEEAVKLLTEETRFLPCARRLH